MASVDRPVTSESGPARRGSGATRQTILDAARVRLLADGYAGLSTRAVAEAAGVPLSQVHYHFGSKRQLIVDLLASESERLLERQTRMYAADEPLWRRYEQACNFLEDDLESGFVRVLQEMIAAGWSDHAIGERVRSLLQGWVDLITAVTREAQERFGSLGPFPAEEVSALVGMAFIGAESMLLLGFDRHDVPIRSALRRFGLVLRDLEEAALRTA